MKESWKDVRNHEGYYKVSSIGRVKSIRSDIFLKAARVVSTGYFYVALSVNGHQRSWTIHRLVAEAFIPNPENKPQVNHKNGIKTDNRVSNLEWVTAKENNQHAFRTGLTPSIVGDLHPLAKLTDIDISLMRDAYSSGHIQVALARYFKVTQANVSRVVRNETWTHVR